MSEAGHYLFVYSFCVIVHWVLVVLVADLFCNQVYPSCDCIGRIFQIYACFFLNKPENGMVWTKNNT